MSFPHRAFLLAAGLGTRLRPLTYAIPKPMLTLHGEPLIGRIIDNLRGWGVREFLINLHHQPQEVFAYLRQRALREGLSVQISFEPDILGTGGALKHAAWFLSTGPFWLVNTDIAMALDPAPLLQAFARGRPLAALWMTDEKGPRTVEVRAGQVVSFRAEHPGRAGTYTFCGLHLVAPQVLAHLPATRCSSIIEAYEHALRRGETVAGVTAPGAYWNDVGTPERYLAATFDAAGRGAAFRPAPRQTAVLRALRAGGVRLRGAVAVEHGVCAAPGATVSDSVLMDRVALGPRARVDRAILGRGVRVNGAVSGVVVRADGAGSPPAWWLVLDALGWPAAGTIVQALPVRGSDRDFCRLRHGRHRAMLIRYGDQRPENAHYAEHARFLLSRGLDVPAVLLDRPDLRLSVLEDLGDTSLETLYGHAAHRATRRGVGPARRYRRVLDTLLRLHATPQRSLRRLPLQPPLDAALFAWERDLFDRHFLCGCLHLRAAARRGALRDVETLAARLGAAPHGLAHRDMQSSNVMVTARRLVLIDFQGMRWGPVAYDLASLLCDPYVMLAAPVQDALLNYYCAGRRDGAAVRASFWPAAVQRLAQALGAYGRLSALPGMERFRLHIPHALTMLRRALNHLPELTELRALVEHRAPD